MRKLALLILLLWPLASKAASPTVTVTATAQSILGTTQTVVLTVTLIDPNTTGMLKAGAVEVTNFTTTSASGTTVSVGPIYGNDVITDGFGNSNTSYYKVQIFPVTNGVTASTPALQNFYAFIGSGTIDISTATPLSPSFQSGTAGNVVLPGTLNVTGGIIGGLVIKPNVGNSINVLNFQGTLAAITGNSADQTMYTYTLPANTIGPNQGFRITTVSTHSTGTASVTYKLFINGQSATIFSSSSSSGSFNTRLLEMDATSTTSVGVIQTTNFQTLINDGELGYTGLNWAANQVITLTFNVANTDAVTPYLFLVELVQ